MKLGFFSLITPEFTPEEVLTHAKRWGFDGIEWRIAEPGLPVVGAINYWNGNRCSLSTNDLTKSLTKLHKQASTLGLASPSICPYVNCFQVESHAPLMAAAAEAGIAAVRIVSPAYDPQRHYKRQFNELRSAFARVEKLARQYSVRACLLQHAGSVTHSASACAAAVEGLDPEHIGVFLDTGHMLTEGSENFGIIVDTLGEYLAEVHLRNGVMVPAKTTQDGFQRFVPAYGALDCGLVDLECLGARLRASEFKGWLMLEDFSDRPTELRMTEGLAVMRRLAGLNKQR